MAVDDANTVALLHFDGSDASTTFTDESGKIWTANGNAELDTAQKEFGTASALFDNDAASFIETPYHADFDLGSSDWTIDFWARLVDLKYHEFVQIGEYPNDIAVLMLNGALAVKFGDDLVATTPGISINTWAHIAIVKTHSTDNLQLFVDGVSKKSVTNTAHPAISGTSRIGRGYSGYATDGWIDEVRVSNVARWSSGFTPPTSEYTDSNVNVAATTASLTITPNAATVDVDLTISPSTVALTITPNAATVVWGIGVNANTKSLTITPNAATVRHDHDILATAATLTIAPQAATVKLNVPVSATTATLTITPFAADVEADIVHVNAATATLTITANAAVVKYDIPVNATTATLTITPNAATVWDGAAWAVWIAANESRATKYYYFILTGSADSLDDVTIPISSFQARRSYSSPTYLSVVIKDLTYATAISNRPNGDMQILMEYGVAGVIEYSSVIVEVDLENITIYEGGSNSSISLVGHRTESYTPKAILLDNIVYGQLKNGKYRYRASIPNLYLSPGDTATADGNEFVVDEIQYIVSPIMQMMEVRET